MTLATVLFALSLMAAIANIGSAAANPSTQTANVKNAPVLLYVYAPDCGACQKFMAEAGAIYPKTREAQRLPMVRVTLDAWRQGDHPFTDCAIDPVFATPTFVQVIDCQEVDRITGYSSDELWWFSVKRLIDRLPDDAEHTIHSAL